MLTSQSAKKVESSVDETDHAAVETMTGKVKLMVSRRMQACDMKCFSKLFSILSTRLTGSIDSKTGDRLIQESARSLLPESQPQIIVHRQVVVLFNSAHGC